jgi:hypothetical protein
MFEADEIVSSSKRVARKGIKATEQFKNAITPN